MYMYVDVHVHQCTHSQHLLATLPEPINGYGSEQLDHCTHSKVIRLHYDWLLYVM